MKASVRDLFVPFTVPLEGLVRWFYQDVKGLVTIGIGNLVDPIETALSLPMVHIGTDIPATPAEIRADWQRVKNHPDAARLGHRSTGQITTLRLTDAGVSHVVNQRLALNEKLLRQQYPDYDNWPADAQLATHSMAWACGPMFGGSHSGGFPRLASLLRAGDFASAANQCQMATKGNPGLIPRNGANKALYTAAASHGRDPDAVSWHVLTALDPRHWPARPTPPMVEAAEPANDVELIDGGIVRPRVPLPDRDPPPDAA